MCISPSPEVVGIAPTLGTSSHVASRSLLATWSQSPEPKFSFWLTNRTSTTLLSIGDPATVSAHSIYHSDKFRLILRNMLSGDCPNDLVRISRLRLNPTQTISSRRRSNHAMFVLIVGLTMSMMLRPFFCHTASCCPYLSSQ